MMNCKMRIKNVDGVWLDLMRNGGRLESSVGEQMFASLLLFVRS